MSKLKYISFKNYKAFGPEETKIELRPITLFIGKNSSGKSSVLKLISIIGNLVSGECTTPLVLENADVSLGARFEDLFHNNDTTNLSLKLEYENGLTIDSSYYVDKGNLFVFNYRVEKLHERDFCIKGNGYQNPDFKGLIHEEAIKSMHVNASDLHIDVSYIGPFRSLPPRNILSNTAKFKVGPNGKDAYAILLESFLSEDKSLFNKVSEWFKNNMDGQGLDFERNSPSSGTYSLYIKHGRAKVNIVDVGQGIGQLIPIVTQAFLTNAENLFIIEQPVLHLHPSAHANVAYLLAETAKYYNRQCIIETHSENVLLAIRNAIVQKESVLTEKDVVIYYVDSDDDEAYLQQINIDKDGQLSSWPIGVFSESFDLLAEIMKNREQ